MVDSTLDDAELLDACTTGDERALAALYDRYGGLAYGVALRVVRDYALAEDAVQDAFLAVWRGAAAFDRDRGKASTWILTLVHRRSVDLVRRQHRFNVVRDELWAGLPPAVDAVDEHAARRIDVRDALRTLSDAEREVVELAYWSGMTQTQIATALGVPAGTVKSRTFSALAKLRVALSRPDAVTA